MNSYPGRENIVIAGNMRLRAAQELGWDEVPVLVCVAPSERRGAVEPQGQQPVLLYIFAVTTGSVRMLLRLEGGVALILSVALYITSGGNIWLLLPLVLAVDVSMIGYAAGPRVGAITYNALHSWIPGLALLGVGFWIGASPLLVAGAVLTAHVGMDRLFGYGLKYPTGFADTHLGRIGRPSRATSTQ